MTRYDSFRPTRTVSVSAGEPGVDDLRPPMIKTRTELAEKGGCDDENAFKSPGSACRSACGVGLSCIFHFEHLLCGNADRSRMCGRGLRCMLLPVCATAHGGDCNGVGSRGCLFRSYHRSATFCTSDDGPADRLVHPCLPESQALGLKTVSRRSALCRRQGFLCRPDHVRSPLWVYPCRDP